MNLEFNGKTFCAFCFSLCSGGVCPCCGHPNGAEFLAAGTILNGKYVVGQCLHSNGYVTEYYGFDPAAEERFRIREYHPGSLAKRRPSGALEVRASQASEYERGMKYFIQRMQMPTRLSGELSVPEVVASFFENSTSYFVVREQQGISVREWMCGWDRYDTQQAVAALHGLLMVLHAFHAKRSVHGNISADTVFITADGLVLDGFAPSGDDLRLFTRDAVVADRAMEYLPVSAFSGERDAASTDIFSVAAVIYSLLTGLEPSSPFSGQPRFDFEALQNSGAEASLCELLADMGGMGNQVYTSVAQIFERNASLFRTYGLRVPHRKAPTVEQLNPVSAEEYQTPVQQGADPQTSAAKVVLPILAALILLGAGLLAVNVWKKHKANGAPDKTASETAVSVSQKSHGAEKGSSTALQSSEPVSIELVTEPAAEASTDDSTEASKENIPRRTKKYETVTETEPKSESEKITLPHKNLR